MEQSTKLKDFQIIKKLGDGSFSQVFLAKRIKDQNFYAIKKIKLNLLSQKEQQNALNEVRILASINDNNIISYKETFIDEAQQTLFLVLEYANLGDIFGKLQILKKKSEQLQENEIWKCLIHILAGLRSLHTRKICHRDIKCGNIFICQDENNNSIYKLGDFNVSKITENDQMKTQTGTPYYCAPEIWKNLQYDCKSDIWSLGCVIYEMCSLKPPFLGQNMDQLCQKVCKGDFQRIPEVYSDDLFFIIQDCLKSNPQKRLSSKQLLQKTIINKKILELDLQNQLSQEAIELIQTIKMPQSINQLKLKLPKANYETPVLKLQSKDQIENLPQKTRSFHEVKKNINQKEKQILQHLSPNLQIYQVKQNNAEKKRDLSIFSLQRLEQIKQMNFDKLIKNDFSALNLR